MNKKLNAKEWIQRYSDDLYAYAFSKTGNAALAEDLVQDTFLGAFKSQDGFRGEGSESTWLFGILKNRIASHYKKASTRFEKNSVNAEEVLGDFFDADGRWKKTTVPVKLRVKQSDSIENKELAKIIQLCFGKLNYNLKQVLTLKLIEEQETEIICKELGITDTNYWVMVHRAKLLVRNCLEKNWINEK